MAETYSLYPLVRWNAKDLIEEQGVVDAGRAWTEKAS